ncbi:MAG: hypothetical protein M8841_00765 [marine benthic group bacterium]|nr:hypothetical protein [Gemmatimonadota bacterium]
MMGTFEYVMVLVSIVIGLAITYLLNALAAGVHRLRGHGEPLRLDAVYLLWIGFVLIWLISFWWWEFKFQEVEAWSFGLYLFVITYAVGLFLLAAVLVPNRMEGVGDSFEYFMDGRKWFFWGLILLVGLDTIDSFLKSAEWGLRPFYLMQSGVIVAAALAGLMSTRRSVQLVGAVAAFAVQMAYMFREVGVLGSW